jgi:RNA polymerase-binding protein DksA
VAKSSSKKPVKKPTPEATKAKAPPTPPAKLAAPVAKLAARKNAEPAPAPKPAVAKAPIAKPPIAKPAEPKVIKKAPEPIVMKPVKKPEPPPMPVVVPASVPTDGRPRKNVLGITPKELEFYRDLILAKRREIVGDMSSMEREALRTGGGSNLSNLPIHMADMGTDNYEQEFTLGLMEKDRKLLRDLNDALAKIQNGTYGICEGTGKPISKARLEAQPWARYSIEWARKLERRIP